MHYEEHRQVKNLQCTVSTFESKLQPLIGQTNKFLNEISIEEDSVPLSLCVSNNKGRPDLNGVFTEDGLASMLEDADIKKLDMI